MNAYGPTSITVSIRERLDATREIDFKMEFVATTAEESNEKGAQFFALLGAFVSGYAEAGS